VSAVEMSWQGEKEHLVCQWAHASQRAGLTKDTSPHSFRHYAASQMLRYGVGFPAVMKLLGHSSPDMTMLYLEIVLTDLQREFHLARSQPRHLAPQPNLSSAQVWKASSIPYSPFNTSWKCFAVLYHPCDDRKPVKEKLNERKRDG
jgi:hypothetical protein